MFNLTAKEKIQNALRRAYRPSSVARERSKTVFLSAFKTSFPLATMSVEGGTFKFRYFTRGFVTALAFIGLVGTITTYADYADVSPSNALYPLKRTSESVRLSLAGETKRPAIHLELANRRRKEMKDTSEKVRVEQLANDFTNELKQSIVITVSAPVVPPEISAPAVAAPTVATASVRTFQIEFRSGKSAPKNVQEDSRSDKNRGGDDSNERKDNGEEGNGKSENRLMRVSDDPFCDQLQEMVSDPDPDIQAVTANDPVLHTLLSERCRFETQSESPFVAPGGILLASTSIPSIP